ncbi:MAG: lipopolysaccharide heptosyltransferase II [Candidatus Omnitrophica bacterium]|nr:lipopolysaccharide heptosyltransferase II [Candidatus Omnitrophota bacterium]
MALTVLQLVPAMRAGGVETGTIDIARALIDRGHQAIVVSAGGPLVAQLEAMGAIHYTLPVDKKNPWIILKTSRRVREIVESHGVDVIHARSRVPAFVGYLAWRKTAAAISLRVQGRESFPCFITTAHGHYSVHPFSRVMGWGRAVIVISERIARHMIDRFGVSPQRIRLIHRGVRIDQFAWKEPRMEAPKGQWNIGVIGRLTPIKGHRELLKAFSIIAKNFPQSKLWVIGEASPEHQGYLKELQSITAGLGLSERVEFTGREPDIPGRLVGLDLVVVPSTGQEGFGRVLIEAGAAGVPVVATTAGGMGEVIEDQKTGLLVPPGDPVALASAMTRLLKDRALAVEFSKRARRVIEKQFHLNRMVEQTFGVYEECARQLRILVIKLSSIGDVVLATPSLRALRGRFPKAHITVLVGRESREILHRCPYVDELIVFDKQRDGSLPGLLALAKKLRQAQVDVTVDFQNNRTSHWIAWLTGAPQRYGYAGRRWSRLLTHRAEHPLAPMLPVQHQFVLLKLLGIDAAPAGLEMWPGPSDQAKADELLQGSWMVEGQPLVVIHPGSNPRWVSKRWPAEHVAQLVDRLAAFAKARVVLTGSDGEKELIDRIYRLCEVKPILVVGSTSLNELGALIRRTGVFVGGDTAPLHVAAAVGVPLVALYGPTDPLRHLPPASRVTLLKKNLPCSPCYRGTCYRKGGGFMECMKSISVDEVFEAVVSHLKTAQQTAG